MRACAAWRGVASLSDSSVRASNAYVTALLQRAEWDGNILVIGSVPISQPHRVVRVPCWLCTRRRTVTVTVHIVHMSQLLSTGHGCCVAAVCVYGVMMMHPGGPPSMPSSCVMHCKPFLVTISTPGASPAHVCVMTGCLSMARAH